MNLKKLTSSVLAGAMIFTSLAFYKPVKADEISDQYFEELKKISTWEKVESDSKLETKLELTEKDFNMSFGYDIDIKSNYDQKELKGESTIKLTPKSTDTPQVPDIKIYFDKDTMYVNKEAVNTLFEQLYIDKKFSKDFVKITGTSPSTLPASMGINAEILKNYSQNSAQMSQKAIDFLKGMNLGIDLGLVKEGNSYSLNWDENKTVDVFNAYMKFVFKNPNYIFDSYKDIFGIDIFALYGEMGLNITKEDMNSSMAEVYDMWVKEVEPMLPKIKEILKGSKFTMKQTYGENEYKSETSMFIQVDAAKAEQLFSEGNYDTKSTTDTNPKATFVLNINQTAKNNPDLKVSLPSSYDEFDLNKYMEEQQKKYQEQEKQFQESLEKEMPSIETKEDILQFTISPSKKTLVSNEFGEISKSSIKCKVENGTLYVSKNDIEKMLLDTLDSDDEYLPFKKTMEENGFTVKWDAKRHEVVATMNF